MKKTTRNSIILLIITAFLLWYILKDNFDETIQTLFSVNVYWLILALLIYIGYFCLEVLTLKKLINQYHDYSFLKSAKLHLYTLFFNGITPFALGGQPFQIYELSKDGVPLVKGTIVIIQKIIAFQTALVIMAVIAILSNIYFKYITYTNFLIYLVVFGFFVNFLLLLLVFLISRSKTFSNNLINWVINILSKLKLVKNTDKLYKKWAKSCNDYYLGFQEISKNKKPFIKIILIQIIACIIWFAIPFFVFKALNINFTTNLITIILISTYIFVVGSFIPLPGGSGGMEYAFINIFNQYVLPLQLSPALILWRFINYYLPTILGGIYFSLKKRK